MRFKLKLKECLSKVELCRNKKKVVVAWIKTAILNEEFLRSYLLIHTVILQINQLLPITTEEI